MFSKMVMLPERDYSNLLYPSSSMTRNLGGEIYDVQNQNIPPDIRNLYEADSMLKLKNFRTPQAPPSSFSAEQIIEKIPQRFQPKARIVLDTIGHDKWTPSGEFMKDGNIIKDTNIIDLLHKAVAEGNKRDVHGWSDFEDELTSSNVPKYVLNTKRESRSRRRESRIPLAIKEVSPPPRRKSKTREKTPKSLQKPTWSSAQPQRFPLGKSPLTRSPVARSPVSSRTRQKGASWRLSGKLLKLR